MVHIFLLCVCVRRTDFFPLVCQALLCIRLLYRSLVQRNSRAFRFADPYACTAHLNSLSVSASGGDIAPQLAVALGIDRHSECAAAAAGWVLVCARRVPVNFKSLFM